MLAQDEFLPRINTYFTNANVEITVNGTLPSLEHPVFYLQDIQLLVKIHLNKKNYRLTPDIFCLDNTLLLDFHTDDADFIRLSQDIDSNLSSISNDIEDYDLLYRQKVQLRLFHLAMAKKLTLLAHIPVLDWFYDHILFDPNDLNAPLINCNSELQQRIQTLAESEKIDLVQAKRIVYSHLLGIFGSPF